MKTLADIASFLQSDFARLVAQHKVPGAAIAVLKDGEVFDTAAGVLSTATGIEATTDSVFQIGSITKVWTATLVMQLVDEGLVDIDRPIRAYLPEFRVADEHAAAQITVRQLLSHQAGFEGDVFPETGEGDDAIEKCVAAFADLPQLFAPGAMVSYNNAGFVFLGRLVEVLRGKSWRTVLEEYLVTPLGLTHVAPSPYEAVLFRAAVGHPSSNEDGVGVPASAWALPKSTESAGAMLAMSPRDLIAFARMHIEGGLAADGTRVLSEASAREMRKPQLDLPAALAAEEAWALGWAVEVKERLYSHTGGTIGQAAFLSILPDEGLAVALLTNGGGFAGLYNDVLKRIVKDAGGVVPATRPRPPAKPVIVDIEPLLGRYCAPMVDATFLADDENRIYLEVAPQGIAAETMESQRIEMVVLDKDSLISAEPLMEDMHAVYTFFGADASGRRTHAHSGRVIPRAD